MIELVNELVAGLATTDSGGSGGGTETVTATNKTGSAITGGDKVWLRKPYSQENFTKVGTPVISDGVLSADTSNYIQSSGLGSSLINISSCEFIFKIKIKSAITSLPSGNVYLINGVNSYYGQSGPFISSYDGSIKDEFQFSGGSSFSNGKFFDDVRNLTPNQWYWFKRSFDGANYRTYYSTDGENWTQVYSQNIGGNSMALSGDVMFLGSRTNGNPSVLTDAGLEYDLKEMKIIKDGSLLWQPYTASTETQLVSFANITSDCVSGIAQEDIANNASGTVKVLA